MPHTVTVDVECLYEHATLNIELLTNALDVKSVPFDEYIIEFVSACIIVKLIVGNGTGQ